MKVESSNINRNKNNKNQDSLTTDPQILSTSHSKDDITSLRNTKKTTNDNNNHLSTSELIASINQKEIQITSLSHDQEKYQANLQLLLQKLNDIITSPGAFITNPNQQKQIDQLQSLRMIRIKDIQKSKNQNKIYKEQYELIQSKASGNSMEKIGELESRIETLREDNNGLIKKVRELKNKQNVKNKVLEGYSANVKYPREIKSYTEEIKALSAKKHDYYMKLINNKKAVNNCVFQINKIEELYAKMKTMTNLPNALPTGKIENEINKIKNDLKGNEDDIIQRIDNEDMVMIQEELKKQQLALMQCQGQIQGSGNHPKYLKPIVLKRLKQNPHTSHSSSRKIIVPHPVKALSPKGLKNHLQPKTSGKPRYSNLSSLRTNPIPNYNTNNEGFLDINNLDDKDLSKITYDQLTDYEYKEFLTKKEHYYDINLKLENSIKEAKKMYDRKLKEMNNIIEESSKRLSNIEQENELLKSEIADLSKITRYNEEENMIKREVLVKELPHQSISVPATDNNVHLINNDVSETRNDILNELNILNEEDKNNNNIHTKFPTNIDEEDYENNREGGSKIKFSDISRVDVTEDEKTIERRNNALSDIKKRYIKAKPKEEIEDDAYLDNSNSDLKNMEERDIVSSKQEEDEIKKEENAIPVINEQLDHDNGNEEKIQEKDVNEEIVIKNKSLNNDDKITKEQEQENENKIDDIKSIENKEEKRENDLQNDLPQNQVFEGKTIVYVNQREGKHNGYWDEDISPITDIKHNNVYDNESNDAQPLNQMNVIENNISHIGAEEEEEEKEEDNEDKPQEKDIKKVDAKDEENNLQLENEQKAENKEEENKKNIIEEKESADIIYAEQEALYKKQEGFDESKEKIDLNEHNEEPNLKDSINSNQQKEAKEMIKKPESKEDNNEDQENILDDSLGDQQNDQIKVDINDKEDNNEEDNEAKDNKEEEAEEDNNEEEAEEDNNEQEEAEEDNNEQEEAEEDNNEQEQNKSLLKESKNKNQTNINKSLPQLQNKSNQIKPKEPNLLIDSLDKSPHKESNTIISKLKKEDSKNSIFNYPN